jgi:hypothetical protein
MSIANDHAGRLLGERVLSTILELARAGHKDMAYK